MTRLPPLHLHLLAHPKSETGMEVAHDLMARFAEPPVSGGLRVPVFFTPDRGDDLPPELGPPDGLDLAAAAHSIVVVLADARMARRVRGGSGAAWRAFIEEAIVAAPVGDSAHHVLPVALDPKAFQLGGERRFLPAFRDPLQEADEARERQLSEISLHLAARALRLLRADTIDEERPEEVRAPVKLFISHAKADLSEDRTDPANATIQALADLPVEQWFDAADIETGARFEKAIRKGIEAAAVVVAFQTDQFDSRPWCRREVLAAKEAGAQLLLVDALQEGAPRRFPYLGNVASLRWRFDDPAASARRVVERAVLEGLRLKHNQALLEGRAEEGDIVLAAPPEALTLARADLKKSAKPSFLYPDPPLGKEELEVLARLRPKAAFVTPLTRLAESARAAGPRKVAVSISASNDIARYGLSPAHERSLTDEIQLYLLLAGHAVAYGGALQGAMDDADNFTLRLFELVHGYAPLARKLTKKGFRPILNLPPWPLYEAYGDAELDLFGEVAELEEGPKPELPWGVDEIFPPDAEGWRFAARTPRQRYAWARGLSEMRARITEATDAKLVIGGNLRSFLGIVPGVVEEAWWSLVKGKPLYLVGAFGGCARAVADQLTGIERPEFDEADSREHVPDYDAAIALYAEHGGEFAGMQAMGRDVALRGRAGLAEALNNGLSDAENAELIRCPDPLRIAELVLRGLAAIPAAA